MSLAKNERLMNLLFLLMSTRSYLTREQIKGSIEAYIPMEEIAFQRMFERDKAELSELGIELEKGSHDPLANQNEGYRINRQSIELPDLELTAEELAVTALARQVWRSSAMTSAVTTGLAKLEASGVTTDVSHLPDHNLPILDDEENFDFFAEAIRTRTAVGFTYQDSAGKHAERQLQPWGLLLWKDRWYVGGHDVDRAEPRLFRLSRVTGKPRTEGKPGAFEPDPDKPMRSLATLMFPPDPSFEAVLEVTEGRAQRLRRQALRTEPGGPGRETITVPYGSEEQFAAELATFGPDVLVLEPVSLREHVIAHLRRVAANS